MDKKEQAKLRKRKQRDKDKQNSVTSEGVTGQGVTRYPAILKALVAPKKRAKLEKIYQSLSNFKQTENVRYGVNGPTFDVVGELLEATR